MTSEERASRRLIAIAEVVGCPVETFYRPESDTNPANMTWELLRLWSSITEPRTRERILARLRQEADVGPASAQAAE